MSQNAHPHKIPIVTTFDPPPGTEVEAIIGPCWDGAAFVFPNGSPGTSPPPCPPSC
jgi:hypothetical protein